MLFELRNHVETVGAFYDALRALANATNLRDLRARFSRIWVLQLLTTKLVRRAASSVPQFECSGGSLFKRS